jgi:hypothetical protein
MWKSHLVEYYFDKENEQPTIFGKKNNVVILFSLHPKLPPTLVAQYLRS